MADGAFEYIPRKPEETVLYRVVAEQLETFLAREQAHEKSGPRLVEREFRDVDLRSRGTRLLHPPAALNHALHPAGYEGHRFEHLRMFRGRQFVKIEVVCRESSHKGEQPPYYYLGLLSACA